MFVADASYCFALPDRYDDVAAAPLLCAGLIGYRAYRMAGEARRLGIYGFGAAGHLIAQVALAQGRQVYAFSRPGDTAGQALARAAGRSVGGRQRRDAARGPRCGAYLCAGRGAGARRASGRGAVAAPWSAPAFT